jgi:hypothetical protein
MHIHRVFLKGGQAAGRLSNRAGHCTWESLQLLLCHRGPHTRTHTHAHRSGRQARRSEWAIEASSTTMSGLSGGGGSAAADVLNVVSVLLNIGAVVQVIGWVGGWICVVWDICPGLWLG